MTRAGHSDYTYPEPGDHVRHPLWPELGIGTVLTTGGNTQPALRSGVVKWATGQTSTHCLGILKLASDLRV